MHGNGGCEKEAEECHEQLPPCQEPFSVLSRHNVEIIDTQLVYTSLPYRRSKISGNNVYFTQDVDKLHGSGF